MNHLRRLSVTAVTAFAVLVPGPALADTFTAEDPSGDVIQNDGSSDSQVLPGRTNGDIVSSSVDHSGRWVAAMTRHRSLSDPGAETQGFFFEFRTKHRTRQVLVVADSDNPDGQAFFTRPSGGKAKCGSVEFYIDRGDAEVGVRFKRRCLRWPGWVRVGVGTAIFDEELGDDYADDGLLDTRVRDQLNIGPKVFHSAATEVY